MSRREPLKALVVEDNESLYQYFLQIFEKALPIERFEFTHVASITAALEALAAGWDAILMDYELGEAGEKDGATFRNGADLVTYCRHVEHLAQERGESRVSAYILGTASSSIGNDRMLWVSADSACLKLQVPSIAAALKSLL